MKKLFVKCMKLLCKFSMQCKIKKANSFCNECFLSVHSLIFSRVFSWNLISTETCQNQQTNNTVML